MIARVEQLELENTALRERVRLLEEQVNFLGQHRTLAAGITGERLVARLTGGTVTKHSAPHDLRIGSERVEVKFSKLSSPSLTAPTKRWQWQKIFGQRGGKDYTHLLLIGEADPRFRADYLEPSSPFVFFLIPFEEAQPICVKGSPLGIVLNTNPRSARGSSAVLFTRWQMGAGDLEARYGIMSHGG